MLAVDTGVLRTIDPLQHRWIEDALKRARGTFTMVLLGHPLYAGGVYQAVDGPFAAIHQLLHDHEVPLVMAGDTHDFEYYREAYQATSSARIMHHVVNGGGGAFLSIGTALDWPIRPPVADRAFYPRTDALQNKLAAETPWWKRPNWWWVHRLHAWPASVEAFRAVSTSTAHRSPRASWRWASSARVDRCDSGFTVSMVHSDGAIYRPEEA